MYQTSTFHLSNLALSLGRPGRGPSTPAPARVGTPTRCGRCPRYRELPSPTPDLADDLVVASARRVDRWPARHRSRAAHQRPQPWASRSPTSARPVTPPAAWVPKGPLALEPAVAPCRPVCSLSPRPPRLTRDSPPCFSALWWAALAGTATVVIRWVAQWGVPWSPDTR